MSRRPAVFLVIGALVALALPPPAASATWRRPVPGRVVGAFAHDARTPFRAGQRRGLDLAARPGEPVRAACTGPVLFAGPLPRRSLGVTLRCGALHATLLGLGRVVVRRGARVRAGAVVGLAGASGRLRLGARYAARRFGYVDPATLLGPDPVTAPRAAPPLRPRRSPPRGTPPAVVAAPLPAPAPVRVVAPHGPPALAWAGLVVAAAGLPVGGLMRRARRRRRSARVEGAAARAPVK